MAGRRGEPGRSAPAGAVLGTVGNVVRVAAACAIAALALGLAGCGFAARYRSGQPAGQGSGLVIPAGSSAHALMAGGARRTFRVYRPPGLPPRAPLVVMLHGGFGTGAQAERSYHWDAQARAGRFLVAYPDGLHRAWNAGRGCCGAPARSGTDDVGFISAMVAAIERAVPVDPRRVYATGISNGGIMAFALACRTTIFAAIGPDAATELGRCPAAAPVSVIHIHGTADRNIPYHGGRGEGFAHIDGPAVPVLIARWRRIDRCAPPAVTVAGAVTTSLAACADGRAVELITIAGAGHQWPGSAPGWAARIVLGTDPPSHALDATRIIWRFFAAHPAGAGEAASPNRSFLA